MADNPFRERETFKKRIITASLTVEQREAVDRLKTAKGIKSDGGIVKLALAELLDNQEADRG